MPRPLRHPPHTRGYQQTIDWTATARRDRADDLAAARQAAEEECDQIGARVRAEVDRVAAVCAWERRRRWR